ncbi:hypothetical protein E2C01_018662 [Portunus trituberculatus]|uniref:Uncharacterized protein n=1 Tax=Portunus trituberculatus TaxID=210409 RepID=A0A5B7DX55_PORTR|nr:hypothetical protein [Portunus trituberculatus]
MSRSHEKEVHNGLPQPENLSSTFLGSRCSFVTRASLHQSESFPGVDVTHQHGGRPSPVSQGTRSYALETFSHYKLTRWHIMVRGGCSTYLRCVLLLTELLRGRGQREGEERK